MDQLEVFKIIWAGKLLHTTISFSQLSVPSTIVMTLAGVLMYIQQALDPTITGCYELFDLNEFGYRT